MLDRVLVLAGQAAPGGAVNGYEAQQRDAALRPLTTACRRRWSPPATPRCAPDHDRRRAALTTTPYAPGQISSIRSATESTMRDGRYG